MRITLLAACLAVTASSCSSSSNVCEQQFERVKACVQKMPDCQTYRDKGLVDSAFTCDVMKGVYASDYGSLVKDCQAKGGTDCSCEGPTKTKAEKNLTLPLDPNAFCGASKAPLDSGVGPDVDNQPPGDLSLTE